MAFKKYIRSKKCSLCPKTDEGFEVGNCIFHFFICQSCMSKMFRKLHRELLADKLEPKETGG